jgi:hypothetical protein
MAAVLRDAVQWLVSAEVEVRADIAGSFLRARAVGPDLVIVAVDVRGALGLIHHLKASPRTGTTPILAVHRANGSACADARAVGADDCVPEGDVRAFREKALPLLGARNMV